ncbi:hypothetical protein RJT34_30539 [Clitoria ternatea]|uniref:Uncharacterized protein n=1 Tax=Clitoria ternatea TaxID=43366 RepID=A0AAN9I228_CLITE
MNEPSEQTSVTSMMMTIAEVTTRKKKISISPVPSLSLSLRSDRLDNGDLHVLNLSPLPSLPISDDVHDFVNLYDLAAPSRNTSPC